MTQFLFGCLIGAVSISILWISYIAYFPDDSRSMGGRFRRWVKKHLRR